MNIDPRKLETILNVAVGDLSAGYGGVMISLGDKLGLYRAMADAGPLSSAEVARRSDCAERYVREWLNAQAAGGYVVYHPSSETYELTAEQAMVLADDTSPVFIPSAWQVPASMWFDEHKAIDAFRSGKGIAWGAHDERLYCGVAAFYRNAYQSSLVQEWLPALDGVTDKLQRGARVADVGCGHGHSTVIMAQAFPDSRFWGFDVHAGSIEAARRHAEQAGVADRVSFVQANAADYPSQHYDLICFFDCLHDMGHPDRALRHAAEALASEGTVMLVEPYAQDRVEDNINPVGRLYYAASTTLCCAHAISENGTHVLGAQAGEARLGDLARASGFSRFRRAVQTPFNLVLEARH
ncbi:MAG: class I SAM-dependent methyltransferase [Thiobacillus sp.]|uniref:class I SAM-dependent methyltransferase n=1 Tax=Thiobacillus sp. TaxID=924 RepID=UPI002736139B|nr:class I SAM-dependent methyltransferase [Thiobacillus sp.]MDP3420984.1 class I SAM-dependent methyltransferase [Thiobacillus sp.]MDP3584984.1 class I SAM-dependent methyltransferase [Thiobacillus sp.]